MCLLVLSAATGCYLSQKQDSPLATQEPSPCAPAVPPRCVVRDTPCAAQRAVAALCEAERWRCPDGSQDHRPLWIDDLCTPFVGDLDPFVDGVHEAPVPVAINGECRWLVPLAGEAVETPTHGTASPGTSCATARLLSNTAAVSVPDPNMFIGIQASFTDSLGRERLLVRGWRHDSFAAFGVRSLGVGLATIQSGLIEVTDTWLFDPRFDLGDAAVVFEGDVYAYGCPGTPDFLEENCIVGRARMEEIDNPDAWEILGEHGWNHGVPVRVFGSGPHRGPVFADPRGPGFLHIYSVGFGTRLEVSRAPRPEGPWSPPQTLAACELPKNDTEAYCAGPVIYQELWDPFKPDELVLGYSVGTTAQHGDELRQASPRSYAPKIVRLSF